MTTDLHKMILMAGALIALVLTAACSKVETMVPEEPVAVNFSVLDAPVQTRSTTGGSLLAEGCNSFFCNAWYYPTAGAAQRFMDTAEIFPDQTPNPTVWTPARDYFWPKTGAANFFSYASALPLGSSLSIANDGKTFTISNYTVTGHDNIMIADAVYNATYENAGISTDVIDSGNSNAPLQGIPTIFRHLLAQVEMDLTLYTTPANVTTNTTYEVEVTNITLENLRNRGSITLTNTYLGGSSYGTQPWSPASDGTQIGWTALDVSAHDVDLTPDADNSILLEAGSSEGDRVIFLGGGAVMPQSLETSLALTMTITIRSKHGNTIYNEDKGIILHSDLTPGVGSSWKMNQKIIYHIMIDPVTTTVSFDPAISAWGSPNPTDGGTVQL